MAPRAWRGPACPQRTGGARITPHRAPGRPLRITSHTTVAILWEGILNLLRVGNRSFWGSGRPRRPFQKVGGFAPHLLEAQTPKMIDFRSLRSFTTLDPAKVQPRNLAGIGLRRGYGRSGVGSCGARPGMDRTAPCTPSSFRWVAEDRFGPQIGNKNHNLYFGFWPASRPNLAPRPL